ncbi:hypothetical protein AA0Z99_00910 [Agrococcus sp. 1P02AA]|uniref:hypothetical protein n=1 Tax=Agrococcus sp. 1P02AA TaxID=3132259 RepID=UPI0039A6CE94
MGILDDAKGKLGDAAGWVKDRADQIGDQAHGAGQTIGERAADAKHWVETRIGSGEADAGSPVERTGGGGDFARTSEAADDEPADAPLVAGVEGHDAGDSEAAGRHSAEPPSPSSAPAA